jgi:hypothetical protein
VVVYAGHRSGPGVLRALAGIIQNRQNADYEHRYGEDDQYGGFHCDLATAGLPNTYRSRFFVVQNEPAVNSVYSPGKLRASAPQKEIAPNIKTTTNTKASNRPTALVIVRSRVSGPSQGGSPRLRKLITSFDFMS